MRIKGQHQSDECPGGRHSGLYTCKCWWKWWRWEEFRAWRISSRRFWCALGNFSANRWLPELVAKWRRVDWGRKANSALSTHLCLESLEYIPTPEPSGWPRTVVQLQNECADYFNQRPCQWQSEIAFQLVQRRMLVSISAMGSGKSYIFLAAYALWEQTYNNYCAAENPWTALADESSQQGFCMVSITHKILGESPNLFKVRHALINQSQN